MEQFQRIKTGKLVWLTAWSADGPRPQRIDSGEGAGNYLGHLALAAAADGDRPRSGRQATVLRDILENPESFLRDPSRFIKSSRVVTIARVPPNLILRRLNYGKLIHRLRDLFRPSRAVRALIASTWLEQAGVRTPRALAAAEARVLRWPKTAYLLTEEVPNARTLASLFLLRTDSLVGRNSVEPYFTAPKGSTESRPTGRKVISEVSALIAQLHNSGLSHRDLKWTNILFDDQLSPWLIDLDGVRRMGRVPEARAQEDLFTLARCFAPYPTTLKWTGARFLYRYCAARRLPFKPWAVALLRRLQSAS